MARSCAIFRCVIPFSSINAANVWAVPVIDLNSICGLYPNADSHARYFHDARSDRLHPNAEGHYRMAKALAYQLSSYPANFE